MPLGEFQEDMHLRESLPLTTAGALFRAIARCCNHGSGSVLVVTLVTAHRAFAARQFAFKISIPEPQGIEHHVVT
jgi:hypothetical protein